jgi:hypothetical protein
MGSGDMLLPLMGGKPEQAIAQGTVMTQAY